MNTGWRKFFFIIDAIVIRQFSSHISIFQNYPSVFRFRKKKIFPTKIDSNNKPHRECVRAQTLFSFQDRTRPELTHQVNREPYTWIHFADKIKSFEARRELKVALFFWLSDKCHTVRSFRSSFVYVRETAVASVIRTKMISDLRRSRHRRLIDQKKQNAWI